MTKEESPVTQEDINEFRKGRFKDATENIKAKWYMVMLDLLPGVCGKFTKTVKSRELARTFTTVSDEALVYWHLILYGPEWEKKSQEHLDGNKGGKKKEGNHYSRTEMDLFYDLYTSVMEKREATTAECDGWDEAVKEEAIRQLKRGENRYQLSKGEQVDAMQEPNENPKARYLIKYSPGKTMRVQKRPLCVLYEEV